MRSSASSKLHPTNESCARSRRKETKDSFGHSFLYSGLPATVQDLPSLEGRLVRFARACPSLGAPRLCPCSTHGGANERLAPSVLRLLFPTTARVCRRSDASLLAVGATLDAHTLATSDEASRGKRGARSNSEIFREAARLQLCVGREIHVNDPVTTFSGSKATHYHLVLG